MSLYPHPRRIVTGHDENGHAVFMADNRVPCLPMAVDCNFAVLYETHEFPVSNDGWEDPILKKTESLANHTGIVLRCVDFKPNTKTMLHRTESLDFGLVFDGEVVCYLDNGVELTLRAGDTCVQRGTIHGWDNRTDKPARIFFILSAAKPVQVGGEMLNATGFDNKDVVSGVPDGREQPVFNAARSRFDAPARGPLAIGALAFAAHVPGQEPRKVVRPGKTRRPQLAPSPRRLNAVANTFHNNSDQYYTVAGAGVAHEWAEEAGRLALSQVEFPTEDNLVTFLNLTLFWFSQGQWQRMMAFEANAQCTSRLLGLGKSPLAQANTIEAELSRRRLWACFIINQFIDRTASNKMEILEFKDVPLPCDEQDFRIGAIPEQNATWSRQNGTSSIFAELIKISSLRTSVYLLARNDSLAIDEKLLTIQKLDSELRKWQQALNKDFEIDWSHTSAPSAINLYQRVLMHITYHQITCVLHSSIVPLLSLSSGAGEYTYSQAISAQTALFHARKISSLCLQADSWDPSQAPGFVGYAAYSSCAIQIPFLWCRKSGVRESTMANIEANLDVMRRIGKRWKFVAELV
ncbi:cupin 2 domain-containing protein [Fusarium avenaceum]|nr:cupin 2 domain-containing protein [Fusarium avenaceum]